MQGPAAMSGALSSRREEMLITLRKGAREFLPAATLVAAGVILCGDEHQTRARRNGVWAGGLAERADDTENCDVSGENTEAD